MGAIFTPPSLDGVVQVPGTRGGGEWGGAAVDPNGILYVNANELPMAIKMRPLDFAMEGESLANAGQRLYTVNNCTMCHGADRKGVQAFPSLRNISKRLSERQVIALLASGKGQMPSYPNIKNEDLNAILAFLFEKPGVVPRRTTPVDSEAKKYRYVHDGWNALVDQDGYPGVKPPWGTLNAIDLNKGEILWKVALGEYPELTSRGLPPTGMQNLGGPAVTAGGLIFVASTRDEKFRAFDTSSGKILWEYKLPAGGYATPAVFEVDEKEYVVIAAGGGGLIGTKSADTYVAFALKSD
jgi:quinoprotein glucose dehydrogenase